MTITERKRANSPHQPVGRWIRVEKRLAIYLRDSFRCVYCCKDLHGAEPTDVTLDHVKAKADGGTNHQSNLITACRACNCSRQDLPVARYCGVETRKDIRRLTRRNLKPYVKLAKAILADEAGDDTIEAR
jgi:5-methylcytosine-specific restriction endonuclease McrA